MGLNISLSFRFRFFQSFCLFFVSFFLLFKSLSGHFFIILLLFVQFIFEAVDFQVLTRFSYNFLTDCGFLHEIMYILQRRLDTRSKICDRMGTKKSYIHRILTATHVGVIQKGPRKIILFQDLRMNHTSQITGTKPLDKVVWCTGNSLYESKIGPRESPKIKPVCIAMK